ncbi:hypothetical protein [Bradyrhizobium japonicum]|uniref:hypothetical protein n=1 Tax=Bradyrhizobium japonicum TaxID=375 RepID=UPI002714D3ED|nr:hypothetical protein [Bradyrhizobium japonicum]WLB53914.1 hypothetical protein QIH94_43050 [Bradyrhizobium japonicum]WLB64213.1 hypothetical protein QIH96_02740 [Bradyrhizobium japonicum]
MALASPQTSVAELRHCLERTEGRGQTMGSVLLLGWRTSMVTCLLVAFVWATLMRWPRRAQQHTTPGLPHCWLPALRRALAAASEVIVSLPVAALRLLPSIVSSLHDVGIERVAQLASKPRASL